MSELPFQDNLVIIRGGGDLGSGVAHRLRRAGFCVVILELPDPLVIRRPVSFASALYDGGVAIENVTARATTSLLDAQRILSQGQIAVLADPEGRAIPALRPLSVVDARMAKRNLGTRLVDAPIVVGMGPGFVAGCDVHAVVETMRGHDLGRVIFEGSAEPDTHVPGLVNGYGRERVLWATGEGVFRAAACIGDMVEAGQTVAYCGGRPLAAMVAGVLRGLLHDGLQVKEGQKAGDIDPRGIRDYCFTISDKARAVAGGVLEAILYTHRGLTVQCSSVKL